MWWEGVALNINKKIPRVHQSGDFSNLNFSDYFLQHSCFALQQVASFLQQPSPLPANADDEPNKITAVNMLNANFFMIIFLMFCF
ncbi:hypothetical protein BCY91_11695 [Pelobium manganitolerans]|uniref:Uncharacterized protein n=1 Tax=Pelobium manganitolerans TaxID=1842495 RepID=A0A419S2D7_9SPHI|nr:hypothetical protein BCY91_11695 [Pelobium manganitolerans]